jgi:hypothetical protein
MLQSFLVYSTTAILLYIFGSTAAKRERINNRFGKLTPFWTWEVVLPLLIFAFISGIRWQVGVDHLSYLDNYLTYKNAGYFQQDKEVGFEFITKLFAKANIHFTIYFAFLAFLQLFFVFYAVKNERYLLPFLGIVILLGPHYLSWMNGIRQMLAATMFVFSIHFITQRKLLPYVITILLASTIHRSAILLIIFYFIPQLDYFKNRYINIGLVIATLIIGLSPTFINAISFFENILAFIGYDRYAERFDIMLTYEREMNLGPRRLSILFLNILNIWYAPRLKNVFKNTNYLIYFNLSFIGILLYNLFANTSHIFLRPVSYFTIFLALTTSYLLYYLKLQKKYHVTISFIIVLVFAISYTYLSVIADYGKGDMDWSNFKFFWDYVH